MIEEGTVLEVQGLGVSFGRRAPIKAISDVSFSVERGEVLGIIGESGSGKTLTGLSLLRLLPDYANCEVGVLRYKGRDISNLADREFDRLRGREMAMIFQDPVGSFNPVKTIRWHLRNTFRDSESEGNVDLDLERLVSEVGIRNPKRILESFPHQLSGGMLQRVLIAMIFALRPSLVVADEPTTNLDNIVEGQILNLIRERQKKCGTSLLFITHDLTIARLICDRIAVMYAGEIVEIGKTEEVIRQPRHPYTAGLLKTARSLECGDKVLFEIEGEPGLRASGEACRFSLRCPEVIEECRLSHPSLVGITSDTAIRCIRHDH